jgi:glyoxylase-like metal-dependent hydrolase (beta-lactamase superfamily II)
MEALSNLRSKGRKTLMGRPVITFEVKFEKKDFGNGIIAFTAPMKEQIYLIKGKKKAMVIDNGMGIGSVKKEIDKETSLPLIMIDSHGHPDHAGGNSEFPSCYLNMKDFPVYQEMVTKEYRANDIRKCFGEKGQIFIDNLLPYVENLLPLNNGDSFDLGGRIITAYEVPGHTLGSMVFFDSLSKTLFVGDALTIMDTWLYLPYSTSVSTYLESLRSLQALHLPFKRVLAGHLPNEDEPSLLERKIKLLEDIVSKKEIGIKTTTFAGVGFRVEKYGTSIIYNPERIK